MSTWEPNDCLLVGKKELAANPARKLIRPMSDPASDSEAQEEAYRLWQNELTGKSCPPRKTFQPSNFRVHRKKKSPPRLEPRFRDVSPPDDDNPTACPWHRRWPSPVRGRRSRRWNRPTGDGLGQKATSGVNVWCKPTHCRD